jgi:CubicO group peptidase (beta-lactamase class C family)
MKKLCLGLIAIGIWCGCAPIRAVRWWQPDLSDSAKFAKSTIEHAATPFRFVAATGLTKYQKLSKYLDTMLPNTNTNAFLVIKNDSIIYEHYAEKLNSNTLHPSFSVAKSYIGTLVGIAIDKGIIASADDLVIKYLPELEKNDARFGKLTIQQVLDMRSGLDFDEEKETPFAGIAKLYYGSSLKNQIAKLKIKREPGLAFEYQSINTQLLAAILERASGEKVPALLSKYLWSPLGAESDAIWSLDDQKTVKAFCCLNATAADFAKLGRLYLKKGNWLGKQLVSTQWVNATTNADVLAKLGYKNQWWANNNTSYFKDSVSAVQALSKLKWAAPIKKMNNGSYAVKLKSNDYRAEGILGQIVYVNPDNNVIIVRMGDYPKKNLYFNGFIPKIGREL